ncbi:NlpC/P60 family protein [Modestobacter sp. VKM Ac-2985]|uniref:NlpC/P60 family protein n=1 Tax=Modestobacter sp. VKM Ac-2985 TaxID=3004139 RepID=UPI0022AB53F8|nr:NlpC/P60 family protein [Modestobacter sp. VKM Ac-2985]MCZ2836528.1 NlpC/P60 family protein [Modestobacter sp. VKM Ac-2985]
MRKAPARKAPAQQVPARKTPARKPAVGTPQARQTTGRKTVPAGRRPAPATRRPARGRTPGDPRRWWHRLAVVGGATLALIGVLAVSAQPPTEAGQVPAPAAAGEVAAIAATLADAAARHRAALAEADALDDQAQQARDTGAAALARVTADRAAVGAHAATAYRRNPEERWPLAQLSLHQPGSTSDVLHVQGLAEQLAERQDRSVARAALAAVQAAQHTDTAAAAEAAAAQARGRAADVLAEVRTIVADLDPTVSAQWAALSTSAAAADQQARNTAALAGWQDHLGRLAAAGVTPPPAADLTDPGALPTGLAALRDATGAPVPGTATTYAAGGTLTVLSAETVAAVSAGFAQLGKPYLVGQQGPDGYGCGGFAATAWAQGGIGLPADLPGQWASGTPVPAGQLQVGDLVFSTDPRSGLDDVGLYLGGTSVLSASSDQGQVAVRELSDLSTAVRVTVPPATPAQVPVTGPVSATCSAPLPAPGSTPGPVTGAWGGWANGQIPADQLCSIGGGHRLRCDAAAAYRAMSAAYAQAFGAPLCITDSYRSLDAQVDVHHRKPRITAVPGTSNHGWALAVDLCGGINAFGTAQTAWMQLTAGHFGWLQPDWARSGGQNPEPWHWEYGDLG